MFCAPAPLGLHEHFRFRRPLERTSQFPGHLLWVFYLPETDPPLRVYSREAHLFWDYHDMPFNIDGRTNLLFMFVCGAMAFVWVKFGYPRISGMIEKISPVVGKVATWVIVILLSADITLSGAVILRSAIRREDVKAANFLEEYLDINFPDEIMKRNWRNIRFHACFLLCDLA